MSGVRLIRSVVRAEAATARAIAKGAARPKASGICWGPPPERVDAGSLRPGEWIAVDIEVTGVCGGVVEMIQRERVTSMPLDLGRVTRDGCDVGEVVEVVGRVVTIRYFEGMDPAAPRDRELPSA